MLLSSIIGLIFPHLIFQWKVLPVYHVILIRYSSSRDASLQILVISFCDNLIIIAITCMSWYQGGVNMGKLAPERVSHRDDFLILYGIYMFACFSLSHDQHDDAILNCQIMLALPVPVYQQTNFTLKQVVVSH